MGVGVQGEGLLGGERVISAVASTACNLVAGLADVINRGNCFLPTPPTSLLPPALAWHALHHHTLISKLL